MTGLEWWRLFPRAMRKIAMLAWIFDECREGQMLRSFAVHSKFYVLLVCCGAFDIITGCNDCSGNDISRFIADMIMRLS